MDAFAPETGRLHPRAEIELYCQRNAHQLDNWFEPEDGEEANVEFAVTVGGLAIRKVINPNGEEETFGEARLKRQKHSGGKNKTDQ